MVFPPLDLLFDTDGQCVLGVYTLAYYLLVTYEDSGAIKLSILSPFHKSFLRSMRSGKFSLSVVLAWPYSVGVTRYYFIGRHSLARYLKVRCLLDCNNSFSEAMFEFRKSRQYAMLSLDDLCSKLSLFFIFCQQGIKFLHECDAMFCGVIHNMKLWRYILHNHVVII